MAFGNINIKYIHLNALGRIASTPPWTSKIKWSMFDQFII
jgi:hypothetical protein